MRKYVLSDPKVRGKLKSIVIPMLKIYKAKIATEREVMQRNN